MAPTAQSIPLSLRVAWMREEHRGRRLAENAKKDACQPHEPPHGALQQVVEIFKAAM